MDDINLGDVVLSKAGRDKGKYFVVIGATGEYAFIANGAARKTDKPKKKKFKHLRFSIGHSEYIAKKITSGEKVTNAELRRELTEFTQGRSMNAMESFK